MNKYRLMLRIKDYDGGTVDVYAMQKGKLYTARAVGEYGDTEEKEAFTLRASVESVCISYFGLPIAELRRA